MAQATVFLARKRRPVPRKSLQCLLRGRFTGSHSGCCAEQSPRIGHSRHRGILCNADQSPEVHQRRIVQAATLFWQQPARGVSQKRTAGRVIHRFGQFHSRARTRAMFASITGSAASNAKDAMAAAVYSPTPGRRRKASTERGTLPFPTLHHRYWRPGEDSARGCSIPGPARARECPLPQPWARVSSVGNLAIQR